MEKNTHQKNRELLESLQASCKEIRALLRNSQKLKLSRKARVRLQWFAYAIEHNGSVSQTCSHFGIARSTYLRWVKRFDPTDPLSLEENSRRPHTVREPEVPTEVIAQIRKYREKFPRIGRKEIMKKLQSEHNIDISATTIGRVINRHCFFFADTKAHRQKRLNAEESMSLEEKRETEALIREHEESLEYDALESAAEDDAKMH